MAATDTHTDFLLCMPDGYIEQVLQYRNGERKTFAEEGVWADVGGLSLQIDLLNLPWFLLQVDLFQSDSIDLGEIQLVFHGRAYDHTYAGLPP